MTTPKRFGACRVCGRDFRLRKNGTVWNHQMFLDACRGAGLPPLPKPRPVVTAKVGDRL